MVNDEFCKQDGVNLKSLFDAQFKNVQTLIDANDKNYNQRFENVIQATQAALAAADRAVNKAEAAAEKRFEGVNEFRGQLADQQRTFMPRGEFEVQHKALVDKVDAIQRTLNEKVDALNLTTISRQSQSIGQKEGMGYIIGIAGFVSAIVGILFRFI